MIKFPPILDSQFPKDPGPLLLKWMQIASDAKLPLPTVGNLATASTNGHVSSRMINFQNINQNGEITVYSDFQTSRKAKDLAKNNQVAVTFYWGPLNRQVRIEGTLELLSLENSRKFFKTRPLDFQAVVAIGGQSHAILCGRDSLTTKLNEMKTRELEAPDYFRGAIIKPNWMEFWQCNEDRISDRIEYTLVNNEWKVVRLSP